jgi:hypothetical protein
MADDIADGFAEGGGAGLVVAGAENGEFRADAPGGSEQDVAAAASDVRDAQREQSCLGE